MTKILILLIGFIYVIFLMGCSTNPIPKGLTEFKPYSGNPVLTGTPEGNWDTFIRERGWIKFENGLYHLWFTGYSKKRGFKRLGYATSTDGMKWRRDNDNPLIPESWVEDMSVFKWKEIYFMMAEGVHDWAHLLTSPDRKQWQDHSSILIYEPDGTLLADPAKETSHAGTPVLFRKNNTWHLLFERSDAAIWLATSMDSLPLNWTKVQEKPVLSPGPEQYDNVAVAADCVIKIDGVYYMYYHATAEDPWNNWCVCLAYSKDLIHWTKYENNPIGYYGDAPVLVFNGQDYLFFVTDSGKEMNLYYPVKKIPFPDDMK